MMLTEQQVRQVIREEIEQYLIEEGMMDLPGSKFFKNLALPGILIATILNSFVQTGTQTAQGFESLKPDQQQVVKDVQTINDLLDQVGMKREILKELESQLEKQDLQKAGSLFQQLKEKQKQIINAKTPEEKQRLETEKNNIFSSNNFEDQEQLDRFLETGRTIFRFIENAKPEELETLGNLDTEEALLKLQAKAANYAVSSGGRSKLLASSISNDLVTIKNYVLETDSSVTQNPNVKSSFDIALVYILDKYGDEIFESDTVGDPKKITPIEVIEFLSNKGEIESELLKYFTKEGFESYKLGLEDDPNYFITQDKALELASGIKIQENKINKLRQRLNELRGVYV